MQNNAKQVKNECKTMQNKLKTNAKQVKNEF